MQHLLRDLLLDTTTGATIAASVAAMDLYPVSNLYNSRGAVPFRTEEEIFYIDIDLGAAHAIGNVLLLGNNLHNLSPYTRNVLYADNVFPPVATTIYALDWFAAPGGGFLSDIAADSTAITALPSVLFMLNGSYRYLRIATDQGSRISDFTEIGEIYLDSYGSGNEWFVDKLQAENKGFEVGSDFNIRLAENNTSLITPGVDEPKIAFERNSKVRTSRFQNDVLTYGNENSAGFMLEFMKQSRNLCVIDFYQTGIPVFPAITNELRKDQFRQDLVFEAIQSNPNGNGKIG